MGSSTISQVSHYSRKLGSFLEHTEKFHHYSGHRLTIKISMVLHFWHTHLVKICQSNLSIVFQFRFSHLCMDQLTRFVGNPPKGYFQCEMSQKMWLLDSATLIFVKLLFIRISFQKALLVFDLTLMHDSIHTGFNGCRIPIFENHALISFFYRTLISATL